MDLNHWRSDRGNIKSFTRPKSFPKYLELESDNGKLVLVFPTDKTQCLEFGQLVKTKNNAKLPSLHMGPRYVPTKQIETLAHLAMDYDLTFNGAILMGKKWPAALQFTALGFHCDLTITIPLYQGKTGHSVEILDLI
ncbi:MAG: hypothetical protein COB78_13395 [Hyphomicrobiales bacterium]|nr:MAG: hypothetical protein COB78_13395 [Hyphomicrobiales bacterium]